MARAITAGFWLATFAILVDRFLVAEWYPFFLLLPRLEPIYEIADAPEEVCEFPNLAPYSDAIVLAVSDHDQWEHFHAVRSLYGFPWRRAEMTARFVQRVRVRTVIQGDEKLKGRWIDFFHHVDTRGSVGCALRQGILLRGHYAIFLKRTETGQFRLTRDRLSATLDLPKGDYNTLRTQGSSAETRVLSLFFEQAKQQPTEARAILTEAFGLIRNWQVESENIHFWNEWYAANPELACETGSGAYWFAANECAEQTGWQWDLARRERKQDADNWRRRTIHRYGTIITAAIEHKLLTR